MIQKQVLIVIHQKHSSSGAIGHILRERGYHLDVRCPAQGDHLPADLDHHEAVVVFGGPMSANDDQTLPFIRQELDWLPIVMETNKPFLGVCLGAQLLARILGGKITPHPESIMEIGYFQIQPVEHCLQNSFQDSFRNSLENSQKNSLNEYSLPQQSKHFNYPRHVYHWHKEGIELPATATKLAGGSTFSTQAFCYGDHAYGVQFHPEITAELMQKWLTLGVEMLKHPGAQSREEQLRNHDLYGNSCLNWLEEFIPFWLKSD
jgi:GMP synthase (glutamine-hydrolysing)